MDTERLTRILQKRLGLNDEEFADIKKNAKFQRLFENVTEAGKYRLVAEVVQSKGCNSGHAEGQKMIFDYAGNLVTREAPSRVCAFLMPHLTVLINAFFENLMNGRDPNEVMFNRTGCFDVGPACGGWGHVVIEMRAERKLCSPTLGKDPCGWRGRFPFDRDGRQFVPSFLDLPANGDEDA